jgi:hypothetical protein
LDLKPVDLDLELGVCFHRFEIVAEVVAH